MPVVWGTISERSLYRVGVNRRKIKPMSRVPLEDDNPVFIVSYPMVSGVGFAQSQVKPIGYRFWKQESLALRQQNRADISSASLKSQF